MKYGSRKFIINFGLIPVLFSIPLVYHHYGIESEITLTVLAGICTCVSFYTGLNVLAKKWGQND